MDPHRLLAPAGPWLHLLVESESAAWDTAQALRRATDMKAEVRVIRGRKAKTAQALFDEIGAALQLPPYFGENWDALDECLADLSWIPADGYVLLITEAEQVLAAETQQQALLWQLLERIGKEWGSQKKIGFSTLVHCHPDRQARMSQQLTATGVIFDRLGESSLHK